MFCLKKGTGDIAESLGGEAASEHGRCHTIVLVDHKHLVAVPQPGEYRPQAGLPQRGGNGSSARVHRGRNHSCEVGQTLDNLAPKLGARALPNRGPHGHRARKGPPGWENTAGDHAEAGCHGGCFEREAAVRGILRAASGQGSKLGEFML